MHTPSWNLAKSDAPKKFDSLMAGDFAQLTFVSTGAISEDLWVKVIGPTNKRDEYWAVLDDRPELITDISIDYELIFKPCHVVDRITYNGDGVALVDLWGMYWGEYKRSDEGDYPIQCSWTQISNSHDVGVMGDGCFRGNAAIRRFNSSISYKEKVERQTKFDKAWNLVGERNRAILWMHYASDGMLPEKVSALHITVHEYFPTLRTAQEEIWSVIKGRGLASNG